MTKQTINIGTSELAGDGESLRSAWDKVNDNFDEVYSDITTLDGSKIVYGDLSVTTASASGSGSLTYDSSTGTFTFTPAASVAETNDLTSAVTWTNIPDAYVPESAVTQHQSALTITQSQISDLSHFDGAYSSLTGAPTAVSAFTNDAGYLIAIPSQIDADLIGSVIADDGSTLLVNGTSGEIIGPVNTTQLRTSEMAIALGRSAGETNQTGISVAIGDHAGELNQQQGIAIGYYAGQDSQRSNAIAIGYRAGENQQSQESVAIGFLSAENNQGYSSIAIGRSAGQTDQGQHSIAIGFLAGMTGSQGTRSIAIGREAGYQSQGNDAIAIGTYAGRLNQHDNTIILNASGSYFNTDQANSFYVNPIRNASNTQFLKYNTTTKEVTYDTFTEANDLTSAVTWANVPDANITQSSVTQHQGALSITESQISDLGSYVESDTTGITGADQVTNMVTLTQAEYDAIGTPNASTVYFIVG